MSHTTPQGRGFKAGRKREPEELHNGKGHFTDGRRVQGFTDDQAPPKRGVYKMPNQTAGAPPNRYRVR